MTAQKNKSHILKPGGVFAVVTPKGSVLEKKLKNKQFLSGFRILCNAKKINTGKMKDSEIISTVENYLKGKKVVSPKKKVSRERVILPTKRTGIIMEGR